MRRAEVNGILTVCVQKQNGIIRVGAADFRRFGYGSYGRGLRETVARALCRLLYVHDRLLCRRVFKYDVGLAVDQCDNTVLTDERLLADKG